MDINTANITDTSIIDVAKTLTEMYSLHMRRTNQEGCAINLVTNWTLDSKMVSNHFTENYSSGAQPQKCCGFCFCFLVHSVSAQLHRIKSHKQPSFFI